MRQRPPTRRLAALLAPALLAGMCGAGLGAPSRPGTDRLPGLEAELEQARMAADELMASAGRLRLGGTLREDGLRGAREVRTGLERAAARLEQALKRYEEAVGVQLESLAERPAAGPEGSSPALAVGGLGTVAHALGVRGNLRRARAALEVAAHESRTLDEFIAKAEEEERNRGGGTIQWALLGACALLVLGGSILGRGLRAPAAGGGAPGGALAGPVRSERWPAGTVVAGGYRIAGVLGAGDTGVVYAAEDLNLGRKVVLKRLREDLALQRRGRERFLEEARLVVRLRHPHIVTLHAVVHEPPELLLVFELVEGSPLSRLIGQGALSGALVRRLAAQAGSALDHAHSLRILHRDIKPSNLMVTPGQEAKLMDFGIAYAARRTVSRLTRRSIMGTPAYMAPEAEVGLVAPAGDLFALGVCAYEMLTGQLPFSGPNFLVQKRESRFEPPSRLVPGGKLQLDKVFRRALDPGPALRFPSGRAFSQALDEALS